MSTVNSLARATSSGTSGLESAVLENHTGHLQHVCMLEPYVLEPDPGAIGADRCHERLAGRQAAPALRFKRLADDRQRTRNDMELGRAGIRDHLKPIRLEPFIEQHRSGAGTIAGATGTPLPGWRTIWVWSSPQYRQSRMKMVQPSLETGTWEVAGELRKQLPAG